MSRFEGPQGIVTNGLVLNLDAGDPDSYTRSQPPYVEVLVVAGGGSGGTSSPANGGGGGGGAGGVIYNSAYQLTSAAAVTVTVGAGGAGQTSAVSQGNDGSNSVFGSLTAVGGGGGGSASGGTTTGRNGGSGGGAGYVGYYNNFNSGTGTVGQGFRGGFVLANNNGAAGGGAGGVGNETFDARPEPGYPGGGGGLGGLGVSYSISGTSTLYSNGGNGSLEGANTIVSGSGTAGTYAGPVSTTTGGSGIVIVRYPGLPAATGGTIAYLNGYTIHTFTTSGTFTPYLWNDVSGNGNNGTLENGVGFNSYQNGGTLTFDGTDDVVYIAPTNSTNISTTLSAECWVYYVSGNGRIFQKDSPSSTRCWEIGGYAGQFRMEMWHSNGTATIGYGNSLTVNGWMHLMLTFDGTNIKMYQNTSLITTVNFPGDIRTDINTPLYVGGIWPGEYFNGRISISRLYNRALSAAEITQNYNAQKSRFGL